MCQRVALAIALGQHPKVLIADEPTSDLDVTVQAQILSRLETLTKEFHTSILYITHDLGIVARMADEVVVLYGGCVVERAGVRTLFDHSLHPYAWGLLQTFNVMQTNGQLYPLWKEGSAELTGPLDHCPFLFRCSKATNECRLRPRPPLVEVEPGHWLACYNPVRYD
jgi:oligopeptide/dipeptide ABC transporter ATP-binding protein